MLLFTMHDNGEMEGKRRLPWCCISICVVIVSAAALSPWFFMDACVVEWQINEIVNDQTATGKINGSAYMVYIMPSLLALLQNMSFQTVEFEKNSRTSHSIAKLAVYTYTLLWAGPITNTWAKNPHSSSNFYIRKFVQKVVLRQTNFTFFPFQNNY